MRLMCMTCGHERVSLQPDLWATWRGRMTCVYCGTNCAYWWSGLRLFFDEMCFLSTESTESTVPTTTSSVSKDEHVEEGSIAWYDLNFANEDTGDDDWPSSGIR